MTKIDFQLRLFHGGSRSDSSENGSETRNLTYYMSTPTLQNAKRIKELARIKYEERIENVRHFCGNKRYTIPKVERNNAENMTARWRKEMWWDIKNGFAWCCVYKVASSSLVTHMINIAGNF